MLTATSGEVTLDGRPAFDDLNAYKAGLGYVPEEPHLYAYLTGPEYLRLVGRLRGLGDMLHEKIDRFLELLGIYDDATTLSSYSKGMRQKVLDRSGGPPQSTDCRARRAVFWPRR